MTDAPFMINGSRFSDPTEALETAARVARTLSYLPQAMSEGVDGRAAEGLEHLLNGLTCMLEGLEPVVRDRIEEPFRKGRMEGMRFADAEYERGVREGQEAARATSRGRPPGSAELRHMCREQDQLRTEISHAAVA